MIIPAIKYHIAVFIGLNESPPSVALNFQTAGVEMDLNDGLFSQNARCGYVLKPRIMRHVESRFDPEHPQNRVGYTTLTLTIQVQLSFRLREFYNLYTKSQWCFGYLF